VRGCGSASGIFLTGSMMRSVRYGSNASVCTDAETAAFGAKSNPDSRSGFSDFAPIVIGQAALRIAQAWLRVKNGRR
jgi:hypothetical protein